MAWDADLKEEIRMIVGAKAAVSGLEDVGYQNIVEMEERGVGSLQINLIQSDVYQKALTPARILKRVVNHKFAIDSN